MENKIGVTCTANYKCLEFLSGALVGVSTLLADTLQSTWSVLEVSGLFKAQVFTFAVSERGMFRGKFSNFEIRL
jgi:hypothetical protein